MNSHGFTKTRNEHVFLTQSSVFIIFFKTLNHAESWIKNQLYELFLYKRDMDNTPHKLHNMNMDDTEDEEVKRNCFGKMHYTETSEEDEDSDEES